MGIILERAGRPAFGTRKRVNGRLRGPVYGLTRAVAVPLHAGPIWLTVRGRNRIYGTYFRKNTGRLDALVEMRTSDRFKLPIID